MDSSCIAQQQVKVLDIMRLWKSLAISCQLAIDMQLD